MRFSHWDYLHRLAMMGPSRIGRLHSRTEKVFHTTKYQCCVVHCIDLYPEEGGRHLAVISQSTTSTKDRDCILVWQDPRHGSVSLVMVGREATEILPGTDRRRTIGLPFG